MKSNKQKDEGVRITEIWVAAFSFPGGMGEVIYSGFNPDTREARATIETSHSAVSDLIAFCDEIVKQMKEVEGITVTYRLLKFSDPQELDRIAESGLDSFVWTAKKPRRKPH